MLKNHLQDALKAFKGLLFLSAMNQILYLPIVDKVINLEECSNEDYLKMISINHLFLLSKYKQSLNIDKIFTCFNETIFEFIIKKL